MSDWEAILKNYGYPKRPCDTNCVDGCLARPDCPLYRAWCNQIEQDAKEKRKVAEHFETESQIAKVIKKSIDMAGKKLSHSQFGQRVSKILKDKGCWLFNIHGERMQKRGVPDLLVIGLAWKGFLEFKIGTDKCKDIQKVQIGKLKQRDFPCYVLRYHRELDCIQIENCEGETLNLVAWEALWSWLKKPVVLIIKDHQVKAKADKRLEERKMELNY